jgi:hypothetical protein
MIAIIDSKLMASILVILKKQERSRVISIAIGGKEMTYTQRVRDSILPLSVADTEARAPATRPSCDCAVGHAV